MVPLYTGFGKETLDLFGWDIYADKPRLSYPDYVTAALGLWEFWFRQRHERDNLPLPDGYKEVVKSLLTAGVGWDICKETT